MPLLTCKKNSHSILVSFAGDTTVRTISKIKNSEGKTTYVVVTGEDISDRKRDEIELDRMKTSLQGSASDAIDKEMDWQSWKEKMLNRNISRTDKSIFSNINNIKYHFCIFCRS